MSIEQVCVSNGWEELTAFVSKWKAPSLKSLGMIFTKSEENLITKLKIQPITHGFQRHVKLEKVTENLLVLVLPIFFRFIV